MLQKIDCALIFAIEEEFNILKQFFDVKHLPETELYFFEFYDKNFKLVRCITSYVTEPGAHEAYKYLNKFRQKFDPYFVFIIGISGQISDDMKIGDVCIANSVDKYDYNSKQKDNTYKVSGKIINLKFSNDIFSRIPNSFDSLYNVWQKEAKNDLESFLEDFEIRELIDGAFIRPTRQTNYSFGKIATGESVVDDPKLKKIIQDRDRKTLCVDMESYGFADVGEEASNIIIIRTISDTADGRKNDMDTFRGKADIIRKWALYNAIKLFSNVILKIVDFPQDSNLSDDGFSSNQNAYVDKALEEHGIDIFDRYSAIYNHISLRKIRSEEKQNIYGFISNFLKDMPLRSTMVVQGWPGTGKTTFLYSLYRYLNIDKITCNYLNIHYFKKDNSNNYEKFKKEISLLLKVPIKGYLIIDGIDQFERFFTNIQISLGDYWAQIQSSYEKIILGITLQDYENEDDEKKQYYLPEPKMKIEFTNFDFDVPNIDSIIENLIHINNLSIARLQDIKNFIKKTNYKELDWFSTNLIINKIGHYNYDNINSLGKFFFNYTREIFSSTPYPNAVKYASKLAFDKFIKEEKLTQEEYNSALWAFIQSSNTIKQFLISEHLIDKYSSLSDNFESSVSDLKHIYSYKINSYFKDNINRNKKTQDKLFESITTSYSRLSLLQKPNICYIIGRLDNIDLNVEGRKFLNEQLNLEIALYEIEFYRDENEYRQHLLLIRTIFISLVYLKDKSASNKYVKYLLADQGWDDLNRGFHLEYYGDKPYDPLKLGLHNDDIEISFPKTFNRLSKKINIAISNPDSSNYDMLDIELQTLLSLAVNRHIFNKLDDQLRHNIIEILNRIYNNQIKLLKNVYFKPFIDLSMQILIKGNSSHYEIINGVLNIKNIQRSGWNFTGIKHGVNVTRIVRDAESVPDHIVGAMLIALFYLPDRIERDESYSKIDVIKTLLIHDMAEAYTGDVVTFEKTDFKRKEEDDKMKMIFASQILKGFANLGDYNILWENYRFQNTTTAKVAKEIDKIEQLLQLKKYSKVKENVISDATSWENELTSLIETPIGKSILNIIFAN